jgi:hypothetical protein
MARLLGAVMASALLLLIGWAGAVPAWDRGHVDTFAVLPDYAPGVPESAKSPRRRPSHDLLLCSENFEPDSYDDEYRNRVLAMIKKA